MKPMDKPYIMFVRAGEKIKVKQQRRELQDHLLCPADDWLMEADLPELPVMSIAASAGFSLRPDVVISSARLHRVIIYEHTCPSEDRIMTASALKRKKYDPLCLHLAQQGWDVHMFTGEVGALGFVSVNVRKFLLKIGLSKHDAKLCIHALEDAARFCSHFIWLARDQNFFIEMPIPIPATGCIQTVQ